MSPLAADPPSPPRVHLLEDEAGATAIEYGLIAALVGIALIAALYNMRAMMDALYTIVDSVNAVL